MRAAIDPSTIAHRPTARWSFTTGTSGYCGRRRGRAVPIPVPTCPVRYLKAGTESGLVTWTGGDDAGYSKSVWIHIN